MKPSWQHTIITVMAMLIIAGFECIMAFYFHKDGIILMSCAIAILCLANPEIRSFVLSMLPKYLPKSKDE